MSNTNKSAISIISENNCTSCFGCYNICPIDGAIKMDFNNEGFYKPVLTANCINCGKCSTVCPAIDSSSKNSKVDIEIYASWSKDKEILLNSSSGGVFSELAISILNEGGVVFGAAWDGVNVVFKSVENIEDLKFLRKSKYLPPYVGSVYNDAFKIAQNGRKVLFSGLPCQIATLNKIGVNENLITVDILCHGLPSQYVFNKYLESEFNSKIDFVDFRNKEKRGWLNYDNVFKYKGKLKSSKLFQTNKFFKGFISDLYLNTSCYDCKFRTTPRHGDITLGDYWGVPKEYYNKAGVSIVFLNNEKGKFLYKSLLISNKLKSEKLNKDNIIDNYKNSIGNDVLKSPVNRKILFEELTEFGFGYISKRYIHSKSILSFYLNRNLILRIIRKIYNYVSSKI
jgi:coenzyme F420-reducing hydrogenase beta subunit